MVLDHVDRWFEQNIFAVLEGGNPALAIETMFASVTEYFQSGGRICLVGIFALDATRDHFSDQIAGYFDRWLDSLATCLVCQGFSENCAQIISTQVVAMIQGAIILARATGDAGHFFGAVTQAGKRLCRRSE
ncbi:hypothetical protein CLV88_104275 [Shimia abyssi]|uniref:Transcriptional regulator LmrA/YxaF-like C-terminal domain-containing protein n=1 Tax=Shimia abyssi TaxID=1662395 RepID=A0A2P8FEU4_9RHOB|nr:hypothetical protein CLV88_104275 [Shimia abyssi]